MKCTLKSFLKHLKKSDDTDIIKDFVAPKGHTMTVDGEKVDIVTIYFDRDDGMSEPNYSFITNHEYLEEDVDPTEKRQYSLWKKVK